MDDDSSNNLDDIDDIDDNIDVPGKMMTRNSFDDNDMNIAAPSMEEPALDDANVKLYIRKTSHDLLLGKYNILSRYICQTGTA